MSAANARRADARKSGRVALVAPEACSMGSIAPNRCDFDTPYDHLPVGVMALSKDRRVTIWNRQMENWSGVPRSSIINRTLPEAFNDFDDGNVSERLGRLFDAGTTRSLPAQFEGNVIPLSLPDGSERSQQSTVKLIRGADDASWALFAIQDVSDLAQQLEVLRVSHEESVRAIDRAEAAQRLAERRNEQLAELNRDLEQFAYLASHDLQEPLRTLTSFSTFLQADLGEDLSEEAARDLEHIVAAAGRMRRLIDDLLALSRVSRSEMSWSRTSLKECADDALELLEHRVSACKPTIAGIESLPTVMGDRRLLTQVLEHVLSNAMKFSDPSRPCVITVSAEHGDSKWLIKTFDNGIGIPEQYLSKVFAPFQRLHGADKYPGSGMGLAICKRAIERHGGALWATPNDAVGSCFQFTLPDRQEQP